MPIVLKSLKIGSTPATELYCDDCGKLLAAIPAGPYYAMLLDLLRVLHCASCYKRKPSASVTAATAQKRCC